MREGIPTSSFTFTMGKDYYCMINCQNVSGKLGKFGKNVTLHKLPKDVNTRNTWIRSISRKKWGPASYSRVCLDHFKDGIGSDSTNRNKIPTENLAQKKSSIAPVPRKEPRDRHQL